jgi:putative Mg2+ transporter-C (MgtC) family protein
MGTALAQAGLNLFVAACLGASIGLERQWRQHLAGLRTNTLVALGAAIFITYARAASDNEGATRIAAQVVSGIGFLGAGVIFKEGLNVRGLNTAATLWCSAAVGLLAGEGLALYGLVAAILVIAANTLLRPIVRAINRQPVEMSEEEQRYVISIECRAPRASDIRADLVQEVGTVPELNFSQVDSAFIAETGRVEVTATVTSHKRRELALEAIVGSGARRRRARRRNLLRLAVHPLSVGQRRVARQGDRAQAHGRRRGPGARARLPLGLGRHVQLPGARLLSQTRLRSVRRTRLSAGTQAHLPAEAARRGPRRSSRAPMIPEG